MKQFKHSFQLTSPDFLRTINPEILNLVDELYATVKYSGYTYKQKETALHIVNEMLFDELINRK